MPNKEKFSQRIGITPKSKEIQINSIDDELRNSLWNLLKINFFDKLKRADYKFVATRIWEMFYKEPIDNIPFDEHGIENNIRKRFFNYQWYETYDFIEYIFEILNKHKGVRSIEKSFNIVLEREFSGYRLIERKITPITNEYEIKEFKESIDKTSRFTTYKGANIHLTKALSLLSNRNNPDYRNSIKESISAVENICRVLTGQNTLGRALKKLESSGIKINQQMRNGFEKMYAFTNDSKQGIRHAIMEVPEEIGFHDAKYMLISCSTFINFLIGKAEKAAKLNS